MLYDAGMAIRNTLGERIRAARQRLNLSQDELGSALGVTGAAISGWERATDDDVKKNRPDLDRLPAIRKALKVPYAWLLEGEGPPPPEEGHLAKIDDLVLMQARAEEAPKAPEQPKTKRRA